VKFYVLALLVATSTIPPLSMAQERPGLTEVVVTAERRRGATPPIIPFVGLRRVADFAVQPVVIAGDTRDPAKRHEEIYAMIRAAIDLAQRSGNIELASGAVVVEPLTLSNYRSLTLKEDDRPDADRAAFLIKTRLADGADAKAALDRIDAFIRSVPTIGRAELKPDGDLTLSVVRPDQYRGAIIDLVASDAKATASKLGPDYAVDAKGLDRPVEWARASLTEVFLYLPYSYDVLPRR
jgi:hypothetical protein